MVWTPISRAVFFVAQLEAAKRLQREHFDKWRAAKQGPFDKTPDLAKELRPQIDAVSREMLAALAGVLPHLTRDPELLHRRAPQSLRGVSDAVRDIALRFERAR